MRELGEPGVQPWRQVGFHRGGSPGRAARGGVILGRARRTQADALAAVMLHDSTDRGVRAACGAL